MEQSSNPPAAGSAPRRPNPSRMASISNLTLKGTAHGNTFLPSHSHDALTSGDQSHQHPPPPPPTAVHPGPSHPLHIDSSALDKLEAYLTSIGLNSADLLNKFAHLSTSNDNAKIVDSGYVHGFNHKNCQSEESESHIVATLFYSPPKKHTTSNPTTSPLSPVTQEQLEAVSSHISQTAIFDFISIWDNFLTPWRKWDSSHRCLDSSTTPRIIELILPLPSTNLTLSDLRRHEEIASFEQRWNIEVVLQPHNVFRKHKRLAVFDMDSTLIQQEVIDEIARYVGLEKQVSEITQRAMNGELDFTASLKARVALLNGVPANVFEELKSVISFTPGARELCKALKALGFKLAVLSGGFIPLANYVKEQLGLDYAYANQLVVNSEGTHLTGELTGPIIHAEAKAQLLTEIAQKEGIALAQTVAIGDGANDLKMMGVAGLGIAFDAKPKVQEVAPCRLNSGDLRDVLYILGFTKGEQEELLAL